jgi:hypothetical protein
MPAYELPVVTRGSTLISALPLTVAAVMAAPGAPRRVRWIAARDRPRYQRVAPSPSADRLTDSAPRSAGSHSALTWAQIAERVIVFWRNPSGRGQTTSARLGVFERRLDLRIYMSTMNHKCSLRASEKRATFSHYFGNHRSRRGSLGSRAAPKMLSECGEGAKAT